MRSPSAQAGPPIPDVERLARAIVAHTQDRGVYHDDGPGCMRECASDILARLRDEALTDD